MSEVVNITLSILSFILALLSMFFIFLALRQNNKILKQSQEHFVESNRLGNQPYLQMELTNCLSNCTPQYEIILSSGDDESESTFAICKIKNVGNGTATNITYTWQMEKQSNTDTFPVNAVMKDDVYIFQITFINAFDRDSFESVLLWDYDDILGNTYEQKSILCFKEGQLDHIDNDSPIFLG